MVCYLYAPALAHRVVVEVDIGAFVEAVVWGCLAGRGDVVMYVCEAVDKVRKDGVFLRRCSTHSVKSDTSPCCGGIVSV